MKISDIPPERLHALNQGVAETQTLVEGLAIDFAALMAQCFPRIPQSACVALHQAQQDKLGITQRMALAGRLLAQHLNDTQLNALLTHPSDTVRGWLAYAWAAQPSESLAARLCQIRALADDAHFGVREWAWLALRPHLRHEVTAAITHLTPWALDSSEFIRRFACEILRPRGVWCAHLTALKQDPDPALPLLALLRNDPSRYVQNSVANWLNDASKSHADWVQAVCATWLTESPTPATRYIVQRALRTVRRSI